MFIKFGLGDWLFCYKDTYKNGGEDLLSIDEDFRSPKISKINNFNQQIDGDYHFTCVQNVTIFSMIYSVKEKYKLFSNNLW